MTKNMTVSLLQSKLRQGWNFRVWQARIARRRIARAWRYACGRLTKDDAETLICECEPVAGWYGLEAFTVQDVLDQCVERWGPHPAMADMVQAACSRVASKWSASGDCASAAQDWAMDLVRDYANARGIELTDDWDMVA